jgi:hypothetical protein
MQRGHAVTDDSHDFYKWDAELSDREVFLIGAIVVQWGAIELEIFTQTLATFDVPEGKQTTLPKTMNNLQFTEVLSLWKERVVDQVQGERTKVLQRQLDEILRLKQFRDALVHGMWDWSASELSRISTVRVRKKEVVITHFTADDLAHFYGRLASINFTLRFPSGLEDLARQYEDQGSYISRRGLSMFAGDPVADDWLATLSRSRSHEGE